MLIFLILLYSSVNAQEAPKPQLEEAQKSSLLRVRVPVHTVDEIGYPSAVTMDDAGTFYVLQRGEKVDPILAINREGKVLRSWGTASPAASLLLNSGRATLSFRK